jgi:hypothetical protein
LAAQKLGGILLVQNANTPEARPRPFAAFQREHAQGLIVPVSPFITNNFPLIRELAAQHQIPVMYEERASVEAGRAHFLWAEH